MQYRKVLIKSIYFNYLSIINSIGLFMSSQFNLNAAILSIAINDISHMFHKFTCITLSIVNSVDYLFISVLISLAFK